MIDYAKLEKKVFDLVFNFPERIDEMETRSETNCRLLATSIVAVLREELRTQEAVQKKR
jgi:hypothetical protein